MKKQEAGFSVIELLTVMSVIILLFSLLIPALNQVRRFSKGVKQGAQFYSIRVGLEFFNVEQDGYPDSDESDSNGDSYCGSMKLAEAMVGKDLRGFNPDSDFSISANNSNIFYYENSRDNPEGRISYMDVDGVDAFKIQDLYDFDTYTATGFDPCDLVLCDVYATRTGGLAKKAGMPILYYKATTYRRGHDANSTDFELDNVYDYFDNEELISMGNYVQDIHPLYDGGVDFATGSDLFYDETRNKKINIPFPVRNDSYILMSAGMDGLYGTKDDMFNFRR